MRKIAISFLLLWLLVCDAAAANRFWVGGGSSENWSATAPTNWSAASGGSNNASVPGSGDDVFFDGVGTGASNSTLDIAFTCHSFDFLGYANTLTVTSGSLDSAGSTDGIFRLSAGMTLADNVLSWQIDGGTTGNYSVTSAGKVLRIISVFGGSMTLQDDLSAGIQVSLNTGTIDANNKNVTTPSFTSSTSNTRTITMGSGTWTLNGTGTVWNTATTTGLTINPNTSTIKITDASSSSRTFAGGGKTYNNLWYSTTTGLGQLVVTGANTFNDFKYIGLAGITWPAGSTNTFATFTVSGNNSFDILSIVSSSSGTQATLSAPSGVINRDNLSIKDSAATGGATWCAGVNSTNVSGNTGWTFAACAAGANSGMTTMGAGR